MEYLQLFNDNKEVINEKIDRKLKRTLNNGKHFIISLVFIENSKNEFLIQFTSKEKNSVFAITGGHVKYGDNSLDTAIRETEEEMSIKLDKEDLKYVNTTKDKYCYCDIYYVKKDIKLSNLKLEEKEVESVHWMRLDEINELIENGKFREKNILPLKQVLEYRST